MTVYEFIGYVSMQSKKNKNQASDDDADQHNNTLNNTATTKRCNQWTRRSDCESQHRQPKLNEGQGHR